ncbi:MAG: peptidylprolyl isomerase [Actinomycetia bacterium]|nr:peptidylprolyl isomerase [Actinomycetes bacterium]MCP4222345.1 peptidylprolyl isomerase [Actinomycetes bacterium]MCP5032372.1 peptidylprolyl isomerase [Actinomycetes bacterium]
MEQEHKVEQRNQWRQYAIIGVLVAVGLGGALYLLSLGGDDGDDGATTTSSTFASTTSVAEVLVPAVSAPAAGGTIDGTADCPADDGSSERITSFAEAPPTCIDATSTYVAEIETTLGQIVVELDPAKAPETVNNFVFLARYHYYDGAPFHRIVPGFVIQGGDATGDPLGTGNPGYMIGEEPPEPDEYEIGSLAMAKGAGDNSTGSQFFIVTGPQGVSLPNQYSLFGSVTEGLEVVSAIEGLPTTPDNYPTEEIYINSVSITES